MKSVIETLKQLKQRRENWRKNRDFMFKTADEYEEKAKGHREQALTYEREIAELDQAIAVLEGHKKHVVMPSPMTREEIAALEDACKDCPPEFNETFVKNIPDILA
jgi:uncharacterized coiled-coil DUF342 family protein